MRIRAVRAFASRSLRLSGCICLAAVANLGAQLAPTVAGSPSAGASPAAATLLQQVRFEQRLNSELPLAASFKDEAGRPVVLGSYFDGRPAILALVYYRCTMLCNEVLTGLTSSLAELKLNPGRDFQVVIVSFDPRETPAMAAANRYSVLRRYHRAGTEEGWHFLTGDPSSIHSLADSVGFSYIWDEKTNQFAHPTGIVIVTPEGRVAQYYFGIEFSPRDLRLGLVEASHYRIGNLIDEVTLYCYHYDPTIGGYGPVAMRILRLTSIAFVLVLIGFIFFSVRKERKSRSRVVIAVKLREQARTR